jgi:tRNA G18 (ribose-2'-O)-methylase SpoU
MGSVFARPPARGEPGGTLIALDSGGKPLGEVEAQPPAVLCVGAEREGLPAALLAAATVAAIPTRPGGPDSLNAAMAATVGLYDLGNRIARHG